MAKMVCLGNEACAQAAIDAGVSFVFGYPGTPSTEAMEYLLRNGSAAGCRAFWRASEKTAFESAMGVSFAGQRALVVMKHVGMNVAADAFINASLHKINGGLVTIAADDPGMHSSQNEQDTRLFAEFAKVICFEPRNHQEAYDMTIEAFEVSERFNVPVVLRLVTRLAHSRSVVVTVGPCARVSRGRAGTMSERMCLPVCARKNYRALLERQPAFLDYSEAAAGNQLELRPGCGRFGVITTGVGGNYFLEIAPELPAQPSHLHIGVYPVPAGLVRQLSATVDELYIIEEGYPLVEAMARSVVADPLPIHGKMDGALPDSGELNPDIVRHLFSLPDHAESDLFVGELPVRFTQLCAGCPHIDTFNVIRDVRREFPGLVVMADIGCYTLGALPPYELLDSALCMGASIGMATGAAIAGGRPAIAMIGDSSFFHSGLQGVVDAVASDAPVVILVVDNDTVAMTGAQPTILPAGRIESTLLGIGVRREHVRTIVPLPADHTENCAVLREELAFNGVSAVIARRECVRRARHRRDEGGRP